MAMRETERSLRVYFLVAGVIGALLALNDVEPVQSISGMVPDSWMATLWFSIGVRVVLGIAFVVAGIQLKKQLPRGATWIKRMLVISIALEVIEAMLITAVIGIEIAESDLIRSLIGLAITAYVLANLRRLADQAVAQTAPAARVV